MIRSCPTQWMNGTEWNGTIPTITTSTRAPDEASTLFARASYHIILSYHIVSYRATRLYPVSYHATSPIPQYNSHLVATLVGTILSRQSVPLLLWDTLPYASCFHNIDNACDIPFHTITRHSHTANVLLYTILHSPNEQ